MKLRPFQRRFINAATRRGVDTAALSLPRGNGKSWLAGHLIGRILDPADKLFREGTESVLCAASIEQARIVFRFARQTLEPMGGFRFLDSATRCAITHTGTNTRLRVIGSNGKTAMGLVNCPWAICDEPGAWEVNGGGLMWDALTTAQGKPGSPLRILLIGTLAPMGLPGHWWHSLVTCGSEPGTVVMSLQGDPKSWDSWHTIRKANPLTMISAEFRAKLLKERDDARRDSRLKARFLSYRLNVPSGDESTMLLTVDDWEHVENRPIPEREGRPIVGVDLGGGRAWSAAVAIWRNGRVEAVAVAPGLPSLAAQEKRDRVPAGTYTRLVENGSLSVAHGLRVQPPGQLWECVRSAWGVPEVVICDRFRANDLRDSIQGACPLVPRVTRWSEAGQDIRAVRKLAKDGPLAVDPVSRPLLVASLSAAMVKNDDQGNYRLAKRDASNNSSRDDVAAALTLACGALSRAPESGAGFRYLGAA